MNMYKFKILRTSFQVTILLQLFKFLYSNYYLLNKRHKVSRPCLLDSVSLSMLSNLKKVRLHSGQLSQHWVEKSRPHIHNKSQGVLGTLLFYFLSMWPQWRSYWRWGSLWPWCSRLSASRCLSSEPLPHTPKSHTCWFWRKSASVF